jgi:universal stress protein E
MKQQQTRLFVVIDPTAPHQLALVKALLIAKLGVCHIHAFLCVYKDVKEAGAFASRKEFKHKSCAEANDWLEDLMKPCKQSGVSYSTEVIWNSKWVASLVRSVERSECDLVIKSSYQHSKARRLFSKTSDYHLMRNCSHPILFTHRAQDWESDRILACLDLETPDTGHSRLNKAILDDTRAFAEVVGMDLYIACAYQNTISRDHLELKPGPGAVTAEQLGEHFHLPPERILLRQGKVVESLQAICHEADPSIVVMGTLARRGIRGKLIGNTAEKLLDGIEADLMTIY